MPSAGAGQAAEDCGGLATTLVADKQTILAIEYDPLHVPLTKKVANSSGSGNNVGSRKKE